MVTKKKYIQAIWDGYVDILKMINFDRESMDIDFQEEKKLGL